jgi:hypothetical protein
MHRSATIRRGPGVKIEQLSNTLADPNWCVVHQLRKPTTSPAHGMS